MAYISTEKAAKIRKALKEAFPEIKFSVSKTNHISLNVRIMESPYFDDGEHCQVNQYWIKHHFDDNHAQRDVLLKIDEIIRAAGDYFDNSDPMTDYFHTAFYYDIAVGRWDKPHKNIAKRGSLS